MHWKTDADLYPPYLRARIRRRRGVGAGLAYAPWLKARDVPSRGTSSVVPGIRVARPHHLLSELEAIYFFLTERKSSTIDIREAWPILDIDRTLELCEEFGVSHKYRGHFPEPFTLDFLVTEETNEGLRYRAASIKTEGDAADPNVRQRLAVEHEWCKERGIPWTLVDTSEFDKRLLSNLRFMRSWFRHHYEVDQSHAARFADCFLASYGKNVPLQELIDVAARDMRLAKPVAQDTFRYCVWVDQIAVSLLRPLSLDQPLALRRNGEHG